MSTKQHNLSQSCRKGYRQGCCGYTTYLNLTKLIDNCDIIFTCEHITVGSLSSLSINHLDTCDDTVFNILEFDNLL